MRRFALLPVAVTVALVPAVASASPVNARLSASGVEFVQQQLPSFIPTHFEPPPMTMEIYSCPGDNARFTQENTQVDVSIDNLDLSLPQDGIARVDLTFSAWGWGDVDFEDIYACLGSSICTDDVSIYGARAVADFGVYVGDDGKVHAYLAAIDFYLTEDDIYVDFYDCAIDGILNTVVDLAKSWALDSALDMAEQMVQEKVGPKLEEMLQGMTQYQGSVGAAEFDARLTDVAIRTDGIGLGADVDLTSPYPAAACVGSDPGEPAPSPEAAPDLSAGIDSHLGVSVNLGLVEDALYHIWREGYMCINPDVLHSFGIDFDPAMIGELLPGFPAGTTFTMQASLATPPRVRGSSSDGATMTLSMQGFTADLIANIPDGTTRSLHAEMDATMTASVSLDPGINALAATVDGITLDRLEVDDELGAAQLGFDYERIRTLLEDRILPKVIAEMGSIPVTGPVFGGMAGIYVILREVRTTEGWMSAKADLFRAPENDWNAPQTVIDAAPTRPVSPKNAKLVFGGSDAEIPTELLRYHATVDGVSQAPTYVRQLQIGQAGVTKSYHVTAAAIDLAGNEDATPAAADVVVDGVNPYLVLETQLKGTIDTASPELAWTATDDLTPPEGITAHVKIFELPKVFGEGEPELVSEQDVDAGETSTALYLHPGVQYRVVLSVYDEAGNEGAQSMIFTVSPDASTSSGGCTTAPGGSPISGGAALLLLGAALLLARIARNKTR